MDYDCHEARPRLLANIAAMTTTDPTDIVAVPATTSTVIAAVPAVETSARRELTLHPKAMQLWVCSILIKAASILLVVMAMTVFSQHALLAPVAASVAAAIVAAVLLHIRAYIKRFRCRLLVDGLWLHRGVFWRSEIFVPRARIQHTDVQQGPIARRFDMACLKIYTAGTQHGEIVIDGLAHADALWLRDELLGRRGSDGV